jgi:hypothetical protein
MKVGANIVSYITYTLILGISFFADGPRNPLQGILFSNREKLFWRQRRPKFAVGVFG